VSEVNYNDIATDWVASHERLKIAQKKLQVAQAEWHHESTKMQELETRLQQSVKAGDDLPPARLFVIGYSYENKGVLVARFNGWTSVQIVEIEDR
jgi:hypothetical protein